MWEVGTMTSRLAAIKQEPVADRCLTGQDRERTSLKRRLVLLAAVIPVFPAIAVDYQNGSVDDNPRLRVHTPEAPSFCRNPIAGSYGFAGIPYSGSLAAETKAPDPDALLTFSKTFGPTWLNVAADGTLSGTPAPADIGENSFRVRVQNGQGPAASEADLIVPVAVNYSGLDRTFRIMAIGDSITTGYTDNPVWNVPFEFGYRSELYRLLTDAGFDFQFVGQSPEPWNGLSGMPANTPSPDLRPLGQDNHRGYGGSGIAGIAGGIVNWLNSDNPNVILLMIGINDIPPGPTDPVDQKNDLNNLVNTIVTTKPEADLIVAQITPISYNSESHLQYNTYIRSTLVSSYASQGYRVSTVDQYSNFITGTGDVDPARFSNGINHPDPVGYRRMAETWFGGIVALVGPKCNKMALNDDCEYDLTDFVISVQCWLANCLTNANDPCCAWP